MKSKITKIFLFVLVAVMLFGTISPVAYESYDTYTYSIDGKPLPSPHAYTPDVNTYDSAKMGLLEGYFWRYDGDGNVAIWAGTSMEPLANGRVYSDDLVYVLNSDNVSYSVAGYRPVAEDAALLIEIAEALKAVADLHTSVDGQNNVKVSFNSGALMVDDPLNPGSKVFVEMTRADAATVVSALLSDALLAAAALPENAGKNIVAEVNYNDVLSMIVNKLGLTRGDAPISIKIPATHEGLPVTGIADGAFAKGAYGNDYAPVAAYYSNVMSVVIGENVASIGENALSGLVNGAEIFYESDSGKYNSIAIDETNARALSTSRVYYYSEFIKFGNKKLALANDITADNEGNLYIADKENNRIVVLNKYSYKVIGVMGTYVDEYGSLQTLNAPTGIFVTDPTKMVDESSFIFVCDSGNSRIVVFDRNYNYVRTIEKPKSALLKEAAFKPYAIAVDKYGRIFVVSQSCYEGVIVMSGEGDFTGFIGAQKVTYNVIQQLWRRFQSAEQRAQSMQNLPMAYNNITVDDDGFVYVTINFTDRDEQVKQLAALKSKQQTYSPVKKLNSTGAEIMKRNGFFVPGGEVDVFQPEEVSRIIDIVLGDEGSWTILDNSANQKTGRIRAFTYDQNGNLLFAFGDKGDQVGNGEDFVAMTYQVIDDVYNLVFLDNAATGFKITIFHPTDYCDTIMNALRNENEHNFSATIDYWREVLTSNTNFDLAYIGIGKALYNQGQYDEAMKMLASAYETEYYSKAFAETRKQLLSVILLPLIIGIVVLLVLVAKFLGWAKKKNKATSLKVGRKTYLEELLYVFHLVFHPFDGFWDLKHEKRGSIRAATTILGVAILAFFYQAIGQGYMFNPRGDYSTVFVQILGLLVPVLLWVISNWCLTTLFDGEGSLKDIYIATCYSLAPLPLFVIISTILTNVFTVSEGGIVSLLVSIGWVWVAILLFFGMSVTHDYSTGKNVITTLGTIVAMAVIMFIAILFSSLVIKMVTFVMAIFTEIGNRV